MKGYKEIQEGVLESERSGPVRTIDKQRIKEIISVTRKPQEEPSSSVEREKKSALPA